MQQQSNTGDVDPAEQQTSLKWYSTIAVLSGTLAPAGTFFKNTDKICAAIMQIVSFLCK